MTDTGTLRVWIIRSGNQEFFYVPHIEAARWFLVGMIHFQPREPWVEVGAYGLEQFINRKWSEWDDCEGHDVQSLVEAINENLATKHGNYEVGAAGAVTTPLNPTDSPAR